MSLVTSGEAEVFEAHGVRFRSYARPSLGSGQLCAWRVEVPPGSQGVPHRPSREEVLYCLSGELAITIDGRAHALRPGDAAHVPAGSEIKLDGGPEGGAALTATLAGIEAVMPDGTALRPPWAG